VKHTGRAVVQRWVSAAGSLGPRWSPDSTFGLLLQPPDPVIDLDAELTQHLAEIVQALFECDLVLGLARYFSRQVGQGCLQLLDSLKRKRILPCVDSVVLCLVSLHDPQTAVQRTVCAG
jgi:hypothetical protein